MIVLEKPHDVAGHYNVPLLKVGGIGDQAVDVDDRFQCGVRFGQCRYHLPVRVSAEQVNGFSRFWCSWGRGHSLSRYICELQQAKTLAHELAHEALHWKDRGSFTRSVAELEAESVAYVVCRHFGLDTSVRSSAYIALWDGNGKAMRESMDRIAKTARKIIDDATSVHERKAVA